VLGASEDPQAHAWLLKALVDPSRGCREAAIDALVRTVGRADGPEAERLADAVRDALAGNDAVVSDVLERVGEVTLARRLVLVQFLGLLARPEIVGPLLEAGLDEALSEVVLGSLERLGAVAEERVDTLFESLPRDARRLAAELLGRTRGPAGERRLRRALADPDPELKVAAARALGRRGSAEAAGDLVRELDGVSAGDPELAEEAVEALTGALVDVARAADDPAASVRILELLAGRLPAATEAFRVAAARVMGAIGGREDAARIGFLLSDPSERVRRAAAEALGRVAQGAPPEPLRLALADESPTVRIGAASALAACGDAAALDDLASLARDEDVRVRAAAMRAVGACVSRAGASGDPRAAALLEAALHEGGPVAMAALESIGALGGTDAVRLARAVLGAADPELVAGAVDCVSRHGGDEALDELLPLVAHPDWSVRARVVQALADRGSERAVPALLRRLEVEHDDFVRDALLRALRRLER
jgi:HEAT repeat protein